MHNDDNWREKAIWNSFFMHIYTQTDPVTRVCDSSDKLCYMLPDENRSEVERIILKRRNVSLPDLYRLDVISWN